MLVQPALAQAAFETDASGMLWARKPVGSSLAYTLNWSEALGDGDTVASSVWNGDSGITMLNFSYTDDTTTLWLSGGTGGGWYFVFNTVTTASGQILNQAFRVNVVDAEGLLSATPAVPTCFPNLAAEIARLRRDRLVVLVENYVPDLELEDEYLVQKLQIAEAEIQRNLRVFLTPREVMPYGSAQADIDALTAAGNTVLIEPGYDYTPSFFQGDSWGLMELRQRPIIQVHAIQFAYPSTSDTLYVIPNEWIRPDAKYGRLNLVPVQSTLSLPLNAFLLSALGGGGTVPLMLQVRYRCGLANAAQDFPDVLDLIRKEAVLSLLEDQVLPANGSAGADGLSQSISFSSKDYRELIDRKLAKLMDAIHGPRIFVF